MSAFPSESEAKPSTVQLAVTQLAKANSSWHAAKLDLTSPLIPTAVVANLFRSARVSRPRRSTHRRSPRDAPTVGDWETWGRRDRAGQETTARTSLYKTTFSPALDGRSVGREKRTSLISTI